MPREFQAQIDDVYLCGGTCAGCILTEDDRRTSQVMNDDLFQKALSAIVQHANFLADSEEYDTKAINLSLAIGDHFRMNSEHFKNRLTKTLDMLSLCNLKERGLFVSSSLIDNEIITRKFLDIMVNCRIDYPYIDIVPLLVFDPSKASHHTFGDRYVRSILYARELFDRIDLTINLSSEAINHATPEDIHDFSVRHGFKDVTINWVPTHDNIHGTMHDVQKVQEWLVNFGALVRTNGKIDTSFVPVADRLIQSYQGRRMAFDELCESWVDTISHSIEIDKDGNILAKTEAIGDVPISPIYDKLWKMGHVETDTIMDAVAKTIPKVVSMNISTYMGSRNCATCEFLYPCMNSGAIVYNWIANRYGIVGNDCHNSVMKGVFQQALEWCSANERQVVNA